MAAMEVDGGAEKGAVVVTGVAGFIGSHVAEFLLDRGERVVGIDEVNDYYDVNVKEENLRICKDKGGDRFKFYRGDICDVALLKRIWAENGDPRRVVHMAARAGVRPSIEDPFVYVQSNVEGTTRLLEMARTKGSDSFVFASSSSVYGGSEKEFFSETDTVDFPVSPYAATKKACELMAYTYHHLYKMNIAALRFFTVFGPRGRPDMAPLKFVDSVSRGLRIKQFGDGSSSRDYTYIADIVDGIILSLDKPQGYQVYNLGRGDGTSLKDFISLVEKETGVAAKIDVLPDQPGDVPRTCADISKARRLLGYDPKTPFPEGIAKLVEWYKRCNPVVEPRPESEVRAEMEERLRLDAESKNWSVDPDLISAYMQARLLRPSYNSEGAATICRSDPSSIIRPKLTGTFATLSTDDSTAALNNSQIMVQEITADNMGKRTPSHVALQKLQAQINLDPELLADFIAAVKELPSYPGIPALATICSSRPAKLRRRTSA